MLNCNYKCKSKADNSCSINVSPHLSFQKYDNRILNSDPKSMILANGILIIKPDFMTGVWGQPRSLHIKPHKLSPASAQRFHLKPLLCELLKRRTWGFFPLPTLTRAILLLDTKSCTGLSWHFQFLYLFPHRKERNNSRTGHRSPHHVGLAYF